MACYQLERTQELALPKTRVFAFFAEPTNLQALAPAFLHFRFLTPLPIPMAAGTLIDYEIRLFGIPMRWRTLIESYEPETAFVDVQVAGPYRSWRHRHEFIATPAGTMVRDVVEYELPFGPLGALAHALFVRRTLEQIFDYRRTRVSELLSRA